VLQILKESVTEPLRVFCNIAAFVIPYGIYKINQHLHKRSDPPWKKEEQANASDGQPKSQ